MCLLCCDFPCGWHDRVELSWPLVTSHSLLFRGRIDNLDDKFGRENRTYLSYVGLPACRDYVSCSAPPAVGFCPWEGRPLPPVTEDEVCIIEELAIPKPTYLTHLTSSDSFRSNRAAILVSRRNQAENQEVQVHWVKIWEYLHFPKQSDVLGNKTHNHHILYFRNVLK